MAVSSDTPGWPRLLSKEDLCIYLGGVCASTIDAWRNKGIIPDVLEGTTKFDRLAVDRAINKRSGLSNEAVSELDEWRERRARRNEGHKESNQAPR